MMRVNSLADTAQRHGIDRVSVLYVSLCQSVVVSHPGVIIRTALGMDITASLGYMPLLKVVFISSVL